MQAFKWSSRDFLSPLASQKIHEDNFSQLGAYSFIRIVYCDRQIVIITLYNVCSVHQGDTMSTLGDTMSASGGYHEYIGGCSVHRGDIMTHVGEYHEYIGVFNINQRLYELAPPHES